MAPSLAFALVGLVASAGCQSVAEPTTPHQIGTTAPTANATEYPSLHTVPPRPQLSYSVEQRRAIVEGLVADRANARYTDQVVRYRTGRSTLPPPPAPPPVVAANVPEAPARPTTPDQASAPPEAPEATGGPLRRGGSGDDTINDFVDQLVQDSDQQKPPTGAGTADQGGAAGGSGFFNWLRGLFGQAEEPGSPAASSPAAAPPTAAASLAASAPAAAGPPPEAEAALTVLVAGTRPAFQPAAGPEPAARMQEALAPGPADPQPPTARTLPIGQTLAAADGAPSARPEPASVGIAVGGSGVAIEVGPPVLKPAPVPAAASAPAAAVAPASATSASDSSAAVTPAGRVAFAPGSAELPAGIGPELEQVLATARKRGAMIRIVGEADAAALALDRARAVAVALVRLGARAGDLNMSLAPHATADQARLLLAPPASR